MSFRNKKAICFFSRAQVKRGLIVLFLFFPTSYDAFVLRTTAASSRPATHNFPSTRAGSSLHNSFYTSDNTEVLVNSAYYPTYDPNTIRPETRTFPESISFFVRFVLRLFQKNRRKNRLLMVRGISRNYSSILKHWKSVFYRLNEQRKNLVALADYSRYIVVPSFSFLVIGALMTSITPHFYSKSIQLVATANASSSTVIQTVTALVVSSILGAFFTSGRGALFWLAGCRANFNIRVKLHRNIMLQEAAFFDSNEAGYLLSRLNSDVNKIGMVISYHVNVVLRQLAQFIFGSVYLVTISPTLSLYAFGGILINAIVSAIYGSFNRDIAQKVQDSFADGTAVAECSFSMSETVRAYDGVNVETRKYVTAQRKALDLEEVQAWGYGMHKFVSETLRAVFQGALLLLCWNIGRSDILPADRLTSFLFYTNFVLESSNEVGEQWAKIQGAVGASTSVFDLIRRIPRVRDEPMLNVEQPETRISTEQDSLPLLEMKNYTLSYGALEKPAILNANVKVFPGDRVAIVGRSGSGKSSMLRCMLRFYDPLSGSIRFKGRDLRSLSRQEIAADISVVEQESGVFPCSLRDNLLYGLDMGEKDSKAIDDILIDSLEAVGLPVRKGNELNLDLSTRIGEGGRNLSGGQRARMAIARAALIRKPALLLLDEPTAALDSLSEKAVLKALQKAMKDCTSMVMVTHRLGAIDTLGVNKVLVMENGVIVEEGNPRELLEKVDGHYMRLAREQGLVIQSRV